MSRTKNLMTLLKGFDFFKIPVNLMLHRRNRKDNTKNNFYQMGTKIGGFTTIFLYLGIFSYFVALWVDMYSGSKDIISKQVTNNLFDVGYNETIIKNYHFLPSIEMTDMVTWAAGGKWGILKNDGTLDIKELNKYVRLVVNIKDRYKTYKTNHIRNFRNCNIEDFRRAGHTDEERMKKKSVWRMCPDIPYDDEIYKVKNSYTDEIFRTSISLELWPCTNDYGDYQCKPHSELLEFLKTFFFTMYVTHDEVIFDKTGEVIFTAKDKFFL